jgi:hypothetical protein
MGKHFDDKILAGHAAYKLIGDLLSGNGLTAPNARRAGDLSVTAPT